MLCAISLAYLIFFCMHGNILNYVGFFFYRCDALIFLNESPSRKDVAPKLEFYKAIQCG